MGLLSTRDMLRDVAMNSSVSNLMIGSGADYSVAFGDCDRSST